MKKLLGIIFGVLILVSPLAMNAEIEATAGSMKVGVHMDFTYRWSGEDKNDPDIPWLGYDTFSAGDLMIQITGKVGDRISYKILEGLVYGTFQPLFSEDGLVIMPMPMYQSSGMVLDGEDVSAQIDGDPVSSNGGSLLVAPLEAYVDFKVIDQLKVRVGKTVVPTLLANTGVHMADVIHTANPPLIADRIMGFNEFLIDIEILPMFPRVWLPLSVTGAGVIANPVEGLELEYYAYDEWIAPNAATGAYWGDLGYDFNRTKGWDLAATYTRDILGGKFTGRGFYFDEYLDWHNLNVTMDGAAPNGRNFGWGVGAIYDHNRWFVGAEYTADTLSYSKKPNPSLDKKSNTWSGCYAMVGGRFGAIQPVYRFDWIDYTSLKQNDLPDDATLKIESVDTEMWHTIALNWLVNDNATVGLNYVIKQPERLKVSGHRLDYPNINEIVVMMELDLL